MKKRFLEENKIAAFAAHLKNEEKSKNTVEKYIRDVRAFYAYVGKTEITKKTVIAYKNKLLNDDYAARNMDIFITPVLYFLIRQKLTFL